MGEDQTRAAVKARGYNAADTPKFFARHGG